MSYRTGTARSPRGRPPWHETHRAPPWGLSEASFERPARSGTEGLKPGAPTPTLKLFWEARREAEWETWPVGANDDQRGRRTARSPVLERISRSRRLGGCCPPEGRRAAPPLLVPALYHQHPRSDECRLRATSNARRPRIERRGLRPRCRAVLRGLYALRGAQ